MQLLHHIYVVKPRIALAAPAGIFKAAGRVLLPVEIIRRKARRAELARCLREHIAHHLPPRQLRLRPRARRALFERQRVHRDVRGVHGENLLHRVRERRQRIARQPRDDVHVDVGKARRARHLVRVDGLPRRVAATDRVQHGVGHRLRIDGDARRAAIFNDRKLFCVQRIGASALHGKFHAAREVEIVLNGLQQPRHLGAGERGRRAAAHVERADVPAGLRELFAGIFDLAEEHVQIRREQVAEFFDRLAHERAVRAARGAERDTNIPRKIARCKVFHRGKRLICRLDAHFAPRRGHIKLLAEHFIDLLLALALQKRRRGELGRTHARQRAPRRELLARLRRRAVKAALHMPARGAHVRLFRADMRAGADDGRAADDARGRRDPRLAAKQRRNHAVALEGLVADLRGIVREELHLQLLYGVALGMSQKIQLHRIASRKYGFVRRS